MLVPEKKIEAFALDLIEKCLSSKKERCDSYSYFRQYYMNGTSQHTQVPYNRCFVHVDRSSSYLFSPSDINFRLYSSIGEAEKNVSADWQETWMQKLSLLKKKPTPLKYPNWQEMRHIAAQYLNSEFYNADVNFAIAQALDWALIKGSAFVKIVQTKDGWEPYVIQPDSMGVYREDINGLHNQEAFVHTSYLTMSQVFQQLEFHPEREKMIDTIKRRAASSRAGEQYANTWLHQMVISGTATAGNPSGNIKGSASVFGQPYPKISPKVVNNLLVCHEIWVQDDDKEDYTTIQLIEPDIVIEGKLRHRNLCGLKGDTNFRQICVNPTPGYIYGMSELFELRPLQDMINTRVAQINRVLRRRSRPAKALSGYSGDADQAKRAMDAADGLILEGQGQGLKVENLAPDSPQDMFEDLKSTISMFDEIAGFPSIMRGDGEEGVRSGVHGETLRRSASPRMRDKALIMERACGDVGDLFLKLLQAKTGTVFTTSEGEDFLLSQLPDDTKVMVDSHSSSPAFSEDQKQLAIILRKFEAIDNPDFIEMLHPPGESDLAAKAKEREKAKAQLLAQHPELLTGKHGGKK